MSKKDQGIINSLNVFSGVPPLLFRLILAPVLIIAGYSKLGLSGQWGNWTEAVVADPNVVSWFSNPVWGLGLPEPHVLAFLVGWTEFLGGWLILIGLATRITVIPLMIIMLVAASLVHWENGWFAIAPTDPDTSPARVFEWFNTPGADESLKNSTEAYERLSKIRSILEEHGYPNYLYETGKPVILNNGIEFSSIYFVILLSLFFSGGGRLTSIDYYIWK